MAKVEQKQVVVDQIKAKLEGASSVLLVDYRGLTVEQDTTLRKELREAGVEYRVYKNTMVNFAVQGTEFEAISKHLEGPTAIAISYEDATAGPRVLAKVAKANEKLEFKGGVVEGTYY
ncbi:MAG: 50S ribosomal protein L10, partial [Zhenhengia sp.]